MSPSDDVPPALPTDTRPALARDLQPIAEQLAALQRAVEALRQAIEQQRRETPVMAQAGRYQHDA